MCVERVTAAEATGHNQASEWPTLPSEAMVMSMLETSLRVRSGAEDLLQPEAVLMFMATVATKGHVDVHSLGCP